MNIQRIRCFLTVAHHLNFTRAAEEQFIAQSTITQQINALEDEWGLKLFERNKRQVKLTPAGESLKNDLPKMLASYHHVLEKAKSIAKKDDSVLRIGYHGPIQWADLPEILNQFITQYQHIEAEIHICGWGELTSQLLEGSLDVIFTEKSQIEASSGINHQLLFRDYLCIAMPANHPLAMKRKIKPEELNNENMIMTSKRTAPISLARVHKRLEQVKIDMGKVKIVSSYENAMAMVASGLGISPVPRTFKQYESKRMKYVDLDSNEVYIDISLAWLKENHLPSIKHFVESILNYPWKG